MNTEASVFLASTPCKVLSAQVPELVFDVWCFGYNASIEPDLVPIFVFGHHSAAHKQLLSRRVVVIGDVVP